MVENKVAEQIARIIKRYRLEDIKVETPEENAARQKRYEEEQSRKYYEEYDKRFFKQRSLFNEKHALEHEYKDLDTNSPEQFKKLSKRSIDIINDFAKGNMYTVVLTGSAGAGKTMLTSCMLNKLNQQTRLKCLFASVPYVYELAISRYGDLSQQEKSKKQTRLDRFMKDAKEADVIALDDLGSETAMRSDVSEATQTMQDILFRLGDIVQDKGLIITTNNTMADFLKMYNPKVVSRLLTNKKEHVLNFNGIADHRQQNR